MTDKIGAIPTIPTTKTDLILTKKNIKIMIIRKINTTDLEQLLDGTINVFAFGGNNIHLVKHNNNALVLNINDMPYIIKVFPRKFDIMIEDIYNYIYNQIGYVYVDCGEYYEDLTTYLNRLYSMGEFKFIPIRMVNGDMLHPTNDFSGCLSDIFKIGFYTEDNRFFVRVGDVAKTFERLFNMTDIVQLMVNRYKEYLREKITNKK